MEITKEQFESYEAVRVSGVTNMFDIRTVEYISGLDCKTIITIMGQYKELKDKYGEKVA